MTLSYLFIKTCSFYPIKVLIFHINSLTLLLYVKKIISVTSKTWNIWKVVHADNTQYKTWEMETMIVIFCHTFYRYFLIVGRGKIKIYKYFNWFFTNEYYRIIFAMHIRFAHTFLFSMLLWISIIFQTMDIHAQIVK